MSGLFGRFTGIVKARMSRAMDRMEDPGEALDFSYEKQLQLLQQVRRGIAELATSRARVQGQIVRLNEQAVKLDGQARQALALAREDLARTALTRKVTIDTQVQALSTQVAELEAQQERLIEGQTHLAARIETFRAHKEVMKAQYSAAQAQTRIGDATTGLSREMGEVQVTMQRAHDKIERMQARAVALDELADNGALPDIGPRADDIDRELRRLSAGDDVERQLAAIKQTLPGGSDALPQLE